MANEVAKAYVSLVPSFRGGAREISDQLGGHLDTAGQDGGRRFGSGMTTGIAGMASKIFAPLAAAASGMAIFDFLKDGVKGASDLNESSTKISAIFGDAQGAVQQFAAQGAKSLGQTKLDVLNASSTFGTFGKAAGLAGPDLAKFSTGFAGLSTDLASFYNTSPEDAVTAIGAALRGESEPIRQYSVLLDDATLRQKAMELGLISTTKDALTPQNRVLAAQAAIYEQTKDAQGDFGRTSGGLANQLRILGANFSNLRANIGEKLLPVVLSFVTFLNERMMPVFNVVQDGARALGAAFQSGGSDAASSGFVGVMERIGAAARGLYDGFMVNVLPALRSFALFVQTTVMPIVMQLWSALVAYVVPVVQQVAGFVTGSLVPAFMQFVAFVQTNVIPVVQQIAAFFVANVIPAIAAVAGFVSGTLVPALLSIYAVIAANVMPVVESLWNTFQVNVLPALMRLWGVITNNVVPALIAVGEWITPIIQFIAEWVVKIAAFLIPILGKLIGEYLGALIDVLSNVITGIISAVGAVVRFAKTIYDGGVAIAEFAVNVYNGINDAVAWVTAMPARIASSISGIWDGLWTGFKSAINFIIKAWNDFKLTIGGGEIAGVKLPSLTLDTPDIPLLAKGGTVTSGGLAIVGEAGPELLNLRPGAQVTPLSRMTSVAAPDFNTNGRASAGSGVSVRIDNISTVDPDAAVGRLVSRLRDVVAMNGLAGVGV